MPTSALANHSRPEKSLLPALNEDALALRLDGRDHGRIISQLTRTEPLRTTEKLTLAFRFRKSIKIAPGLRMNVGLRGLSMSLGPRGTTVSIGSRGTYANVGIPGTGLSARSRIDGGGWNRSVEVAMLDRMEVAFILKDDGTVKVVAPDGTSLPERVVKKAKGQNEERLRAWLEEKCNNWNKGIDDLLGIHFATPSPDRPPSAATRKSYSVPVPPPPVPMRVTILARLFKRRREQIEAANAAAREQHMAQLAEWERSRDRHDDVETTRLQLFQPDAIPNPAVAQEYLADILEQIGWPRETTASLEVDDSATRVLADIDLPEIEDMPDKSATVAARGLKLNIKERSATQRRREYMVHVHGVVFRVIGEIFAALPAVKFVAVSGYSQRADKATGNTADDYLLSVRVSRAKWEPLDFSGLSDLDLPSCLAAFDLRRKMTVTGIFTPIEPFESIGDGD